MPGLIWPLLWPPLLAAMVALLVWPLFGPVLALGLFAAFLLVLLVHHAVNLRALASWLLAPPGAEVPDGSGAWGEVFNVIYQSGRVRSSSQHQLSAALERFQRAAEAMPDGIVMLNEAGQIEWCNPVAETQFDISNQRDHVQRITYLVRQAQFTDYLSAQNYAEPLMMKSLRNPDLTLSIQLVPFGDGQKLLLSRDITQLERVETMRRDFVANVSHELRTPLTVVGGFLETLRGCRADQHGADPAPSPPDARPDPAHAAPGRRLADAVATGEQPGENARGKGRHAAPVAEPARGCAIAERRAAPAAT